MRGDGSLVDIEVGSSGKVDVDLSVDIEDDSV